MNNFIKTHPTKIKYNPYATPNEEKKQQTHKQHRTHQRNIYQEKAPNNNHTIISPHTKEDGTTRIMFNNPNGLITQNQEKITEITKFMHQHNIDILGMAETNTHWNNGNVYKSSLTKVRKGLQDTKAFIHTSDTKIEWRTNYKQGGTAVITNATINAQTTQKQNDFPMGRWNSITIGPLKHKITIITAYIVCQTPITPTKTNTAAYQQWQLISLEKNQKQNQHPRHRAILDLIRYIKKITSQGHDIIFMADINEPITRPNGIAETIAMEFDMTPISFHPAGKTIPTYKRGSEQIDTIMVSDNLLQHVRQKNMLAYDSVCLSDHRAMYIDINIKKYIRMNIKINKHIPRGITSKHPDQIQRYKEIIYEEMQLSDIKNKIITLTKKLHADTINEHDHQTIDEIDDMFTKTRLTAENELSCKHGNNHP